MEYSQKNWDSFYELAGMDPAARAEVLGKREGAMARYQDMEVAARRRVMTQAGQVGQDAGERAYLRASENKGVLGYTADIARGATKGVGQVLAIPSAISEGSFSPLDTAETAADTVIPSHEGRTGSAVNAEAQFRYLKQMQDNGVPMRPGGGRLSVEELRALAQNRAESAGAMHEQLKDKRSAMAHFAEAGGEWGLPFFGIFGKAPKAAKMAGAADDVAEKGGWLANAAGAARKGAEAAYESPGGRFARGAADRAFLAFMLGGGAAVGEDVLKDAPSGAAAGGLSATAAALLRQGLIGKGVNFLRGGTAAIAGAFGKKADAAVRPDEFLGSEIAGMGGVEIPHILDAGWNADIPGAAAFRGDTAEWAAAAAARADPQAGAELAHLPDMSPADALRAGVSRAELNIPGRMMAGINDQIEGGVESVKAYQKTSGQLWRNRHLAAARARKLLPDVKAVEGVVEYNPPVEVRQVLADAGMPYSESAAKVPTLRGGGAPDAEAAGHRGED